MARPAKLCTGREWLARIFLVGACVASCSGYQVKLAIYDAELRPNASSLFRDPSVSCSSRCQGHEVNVAWNTDPGFVDAFTVRLNRRGCTWYNRSCGDVMLRAAMMSYNATCDAKGRCRSRVDAEPGITYNWAVTGCNVDAAGPYASPSTLVFATLMNDQASITCDPPAWEHQETGHSAVDGAAAGSDLSDADRPRLLAQPEDPSRSPLAVQGAAACARHPRAKEPYMDPRLWRPLFEETLAEPPPPAGEPGDTRAWIALHVRPSTCTFFNVAADDMVTYVFVRNATLRRRYQQLYDGCLSSASLLRPYDDLEGRRGEIPSFCWCFHRMRSAVFVDPRTFTASCRDRRLLCGSTFALEPYHRNHHIGHYMEAIGVAHAFFVANRRSVGRLCQDCEAPREPGANAVCHVCKHRHYLLNDTCLPSCPHGYRHAGLGNFNRRCMPVVGALEAEAAAESPPLMPAPSIDIHLCSSNSTFAEDELPNYVYLVKTPELLETERELLQIALHALGENAADKLLTDGTLVYGKNEMMHTTTHWFQTMTLISATNAISFGSGLASYFRHSAYSHFGWQVPVTHDYCAQPRCMLLYRVTHNGNHDLDGERRMSNEEDVMKLMYEYGCGVVERRYTDGSQSLEEQATIFRDYDVVVASHSSQLVMLTWSPPHAMVIEVFPVTTNPDFAFIGHHLGLQYYMAWGGSVPKMDIPSEVHQLAVDHNACGGTFACFIRFRTSGSFPREASRDIFKYAARCRFFEANLTAVEMRLADVRDLRQRRCAAAGAAG